VRVTNNLDIALLALALPVFIAAGFPLGGWAAGTGVYVVQKAIGAWSTKRAAAAEKPRDIVGYMAGSLVGRGWLVAIAIFLTGLANNDAGLAAAVLFLAAFTIHFTMKMMFRGFEEE
jgi:hypothetical protein